MSEPEADHTLLPAEVWEDLRRALREAARGERTGEICLKLLR